MYAPSPPRQIPRWCKILLGNKSVSDSDDPSLAFHLRELEAEFDCLLVKVYILIDPLMCLHIASVL